MPKSIQQAKNIQILLSLLCFILCFNDSFKNKMNDLFDVLYFGVSRFFWKLFEN